MALPYWEHMTAMGEYVREAERVFYVVAMRATQRLMIAVKADGWLKAAVMAINPLINRTQRFPAINTQSFKVPRNSLNFLLNIQRERYETSKSQNPKLPQYC
jgi:hypothetical protein